VKIRHGECDKEHLGVEGRVHQQVLASASNRIVPDTAEIAKASQTTG
jgi:hypothetical protein